MSGPRGKLGPHTLDQKETITVAQQASTAASRRTGLLGLGVAAFAWLGHGNASGNPVCDSSSKIM